MAIVTGTLRVATETMTSGPLHCLQERVLSTLFQPQRLQVSPLSTGRAHEPQKSSLAAEGGGRLRIGAEGGGRLWLLDRRCGEAGPSGWLDLGASGEGKKVSTGGGTLADDESLAALREKLSNNS